MDEIFMNADQPPVHLDALPGDASGEPFSTLRRQEAVLVFPLREMLEVEPARQLRHYHSLFQMMVISGDTLIEVDGRETPVTSHSLVLIHPSCIHRVISSGSLSGTSIMFSSDYFQGLLSEIGSCAAQIEKMPDSFVIQLEIPESEMVRETTANIRFEFDGRSPQRDILIREYMKILLIRVSRLSGRAA